LINDECITILKEREEKQKQQQQEKERNGNKRKRREKKSKRKKALSADLADEKKTLAAVKKAEKEARKSRGANNLVSDSSIRKWQSSDDQPAVKKALRLTEAAATKGSSSQGIASSDGKNECCVCFEMYTRDDEVNDWLWCACGR